MEQYIATSKDALNFMLISNNQNTGALIYKKWYSFDAEIVLADNSRYVLKPRGFWDSKIELKKDDKVLLEFKMGWNGIVIKTFFDNEEEVFLLKMRGLLKSQFVLANADLQELLVAEADFQWSKFNYDYAIQTSIDFEKVANKDLLILTTLHCINYYMTTIIAS